MATDLSNKSPERIIEFMQEGNKRYMGNLTSSADISASRRIDTAANGQKPYALVITCSDSRVPAEHIFSAGVGDLFVIRTAGNVIGDYELGSIEYGVEHLGIKVVIVMGHSGCGAVAAALSEDKVEGKLGSIVNEIRSCTSGETDSAKAENVNIKNSISRILESPQIKDLVDSEKVMLVNAKYNISTGQVDFTI